MPARRRSENFEALQDRRGRTWIGAAALFALLLGGGLLARPTLELGVLDWLVAALLPRL